MAAEPRLFNELRVLDLGAGNGLVGQELQKFGVARLVGVDISTQAAMAVGRDRPGVYDDYHEMDMSKMSAAQRDHLDGWCFNCMVSVAALGFGDIPVRVFAEAFNLVEDGGWVAFNIKEDVSRRPRHERILRIHQDVDPEQVPRHLSHGTLPPPAVD